MKPTPRSNKSHAVSLSLSAHLHGRGVRAATARGVPILHSDLEGVFPTNSISPDTELRGGRGVGSSTVTVPETFESIVPVTYIFLGGGGFLWLRWDGESQLP